ncbi:hypothetical protein DN752_08585 [Echinicola strongylocentroti]|uniref:Uncharacterized protein n=2 Tax=Echinicola strongylocentroti TaxID=1795355 RepID=A0A2Z4IGR3_9BACT|nr:hypothetical protein DN752_08585 [Echinicola strongylocentroti]
MKFMKQNYVKAIFLLGLGLAMACSNDDVEPEKQNALEVSGSISGVVNGKEVNYPEVKVVLYGGSNTVGIVGSDQVHEDTTNQVRVVVPLEPTTGTFDHSDNGFDVNYEVITFNNENGYGFNREKTSQIDVTDYKEIGTKLDTTFYRVKGTFERYGMRNMNSETINIQNGEFDFVYGIWF